MLTRVAKMAVLAVVLAALAMPILVLRERAAATAAAANTPVDKKLLAELIDDTQLLDGLKEATSGLTYRSETDSPWEPFWMKRTGEGWFRHAELASYTNHDPDTLVVRHNFTDYLLTVVEDEPWHEDEDRRQVERYRELVRFINYHLQDPYVFIVGEEDEPMKDVYIIGIAPSGNFLGLQTVIVET